MDTKSESPNDEVLVFDVTDYFGWRSKIKAYLKKFCVWEIVISLPIMSNKKTKSTTQKEAKKDNITALKLLMDGLLNSLKESVGEHTSSTDIWFKLESESKKERPEPEKTDREHEKKHSEELKQ